MNESLANLRSSAGLRSDYPATFVLPTAWRSLKLCDHGVCDDDCVAERVILSHLLAISPQLDRDSDRENTRFPNFVTLFQYRECVTKLLQFARQVALSRTILSQGVWIIVAQHPVGMSRCARSRRSVAFRYSTSDIPECGDSIFSRCASVAQTLIRLTNIHTYRLSQASGGCGTIGQADRAIASLI
jgi:hypothetical protein